MYPHPPVWSGALLPVAAEDLPGITVGWGDLGAGGLVVLVVLMILTGRLVPGKERDYWREAFLEEQRQKRELMETGKVTRDVLKALPEAAEQEGHR